MSFSMFILLVDKGTPFNIHIVVGLISPYFIVERVAEEPNKSVFQADIHVLQFRICEFYLYEVRCSIIIGP